MKRDIRAVALLILTALIWGGSFAAIKGGLEDISPMLMVGLRFTLAAMIALPILVGEKKGVFTSRTLRWGLLIGVAMLVGYAGQTIGLKYTTVARSGFITYTFALYVPFLQFFILKRRPGWGNLLGLGVVLWGLALITAPTDTSFAWRDLSPWSIVQTGKALMTGGLNRGDLFTLGGSVGYAFYVVLLDRATKVCHPGAVTVVQMAACGVFALALVPLVEVPRLELSWRLVVEMVYLVILCSIVALALMNWFQRRLSPLHAVLIYALEPVFAALIGWMVFQTGMNAVEIAGGFLILGGILVSYLWRMLTFHFSPKFGLR